MCFKVNCDACGLATWQGCGRHIDGCLADVAIADRCKCKACCQKDFDAAK